MNDTKSVLLLVGRTGNGKSSVGNTLLGEARFQVSRGDSPDDHEIKWAENGNIIVVDGSRIGDTGEDMPGGVEASIRRAEKAFGLCGGGFNALVFCLRYGVRFTKQEKDAVQLVKALFGDGVFRRWGVIILACGDNFDMDGDVTFQDWVDRQQGDFRALVNECGGRCFLINNTKPNIRQIDELNEQIKAMTRYTNNDFENAQKHRDQLLAEAESPYKIEKVPFKTKRKSHTKRKSLLLLGSEQSSVFDILVEDDITHQTDNDVGKNRVKKINVNKTKLKLIDYPYKPGDSILRSYMETGQRFKALLMCFSNDNIGESKQIITEVKRLFGDKCLQKRGIAVVTGENNLVQDVEIQRLIEECNGRKITEILRDNLQFSDLPKSFKQKL